MKIGDVLKIKMKWWIGFLIFLVFSSLIILLEKIAQIPRYRLFHGEIHEKCYIMVSQGTEITNPQKIIVTCIGTKEEAVKSAADKFF